MGRMDPMMNHVHDHIAARTGFWTPGSFETSRCPETDVHSARAIDVAPATAEAIAAVRTSATLCPVLRSEITTAPVVTIPSCAPMRLGLISLDTSRTFISYDNKIFFETVQVPTTKTSDKQTLLESYKYQVAFLPEIEEAFFSDDRWFQKTKMRKYVKTQQALEKCVRAITGEKKKAKQKEVVVAYGDRSMAGCMRGVAPLLGNALVRKLRKDTTFFFVDEFQTSKKCSCCHTEMSGSQSTFRIKTCNNKDCIRTHWDRDINAAINILINFFYQVVHEMRHSDFDRTVDKKETTNRRKETTS